MSKIPVINKMVGVNGGLVVNNPNDFSIVDDEPILIFRTTQGADIVSTFSDVKNYYKIITIKGGGGYLYSKRITLKGLLNDFYKAKEDDIIEKEVNHYDLYNYDLIVSYGKGENWVKAYNWFMNEVEKD